MLTERGTDTQRAFMQRKEQINSVLLLLLYVSLVILAIILPLLLWQLKLIHLAPFVNFTRLEGLPFELFGGFISFTLVFIAWIEVRRKKLKKLADLLPIVLGLLVTLTYAFSITASTFDSRIQSDYIAFENGAKAILSGINPYIDDKTPYVYPPLVGQALALSYQAISHIPFLASQSDEQVWGIVFYFFQCIQLLLISLAYFLTYRIAKKIGLKSVFAALIVAALFLFNNSIARTISCNQTNFWILNCFLIGILFQQSYPSFSGLAVALGVHIKMYPFIMIAPWLFLRRWQLLTWTALGLVGVAIVQTNLGRDWTLLRYFFDYLKVVSKPTPYRNNSIHSVVYNFFKIPNSVFATPFDLVPIIVTAITLLIGLWFALRFVRREKIYHQVVLNAAPEKQSFWHELFRMYGHSMDAIALGLLISPSVYEHHYIVAIPVALWAIAIRRFDKLVEVSFSIFLIFGIPTFDLFPFSFHRLLGLLMLVYFTDPASAQNYFLRQSRREKSISTSKNLL